MTAGTIAKTILRGIERESPTILIGLGVGGFITTVILAIKATPEALYLIEKEKERRYKEKLPLSLTKKDVVLVTWKCYVPAALVGATTTACFIGAHSINTRRNAALAGLYSLTRASLETYQEKVIETIGEKKESQIREGIIQDELNANPVSKNQIVLTGKGKTLFYDSWSGRYFESDMEKVKKAQNDLNHALLGGDMYLSLNSFYDELGLERIQGGEQIGWTFDNPGMLEVDFTAKLTDTGEPCVVIKYRLEPVFFK